MTKYRIVKRTYSSGLEWYVVQFRFCWVWLDCTSGAPYHIVEEFRSLREAEEYVEDKLNEYKWKDEVVG